MSLKNILICCTLLDVTVQYARETESMLAQQRKENRSNIFVLCPHVQVISLCCFSL